MQTVIGAFDNAAQAEKAAQDLVGAGIARDDISLVANNASGQYAPITETTDDGTTVTGHAVGHDAKVGAEWGAGIGFLVGLTGFAIPGLGWLAGAGWLTATLLGAGTGAIIGGLVGALTHVGVPETDARLYTAAVQHGSVLLAVRASDAQAQQVADILNRDGAINVNERVEQYQQKGFLPSSSMPMTTAATGTTWGTGSDHVARNLADSATNAAERTEGSIPGIQTGGHAIDGSGMPDTRGVTEKIADTLTGNPIDDKTGRPV